MISPPLYKLDSAGRTRIWWMEQDGDKYRTFDGIYLQNTKSSAWRTAKPTNVGKANARDGVAQAAFEIESSYAKKLKGAYYDNINDIHLGCRFFEPMLAATYNDPKRPEQTKFTPGFAQPKLDGMRAIAKADGIFSREGDPIAGVAHIARVLAPRFQDNPGLILDGEVYNHELRDSFGELMSMAKKAKPTPERLLQIETQIQFHVYDMPSALCGFAGRTKMLEDLTDAINSNGQTCIHFVPTCRVYTVEEYDSVHGEAIEHGYEGTVHRKDELYVNDRTDALLKRKDFDDEEFDIVRIEPGEGNWAGAAKRVICWLPGADQSQEPDDTNTFGSGLRGSYAANQALLADAANQRVVTIRFFGWTDTAIPKPRFGVATKFHGLERID